MMKERVSTALTHVIARPYSIDSSVGDEKRSREQIEFLELTEG